MSIKDRRGMALFGAVAAVASVPGIAWAQNEEPAQAVGGGTTGEIIVTAQRREQALQKVPVAVSTISAGQIEARRLNNIDQLSGIAPNLVITTGNTSSSSTQIAIRGSVTTNNTITYDPAVGLYLDGVYVGKAYGSVFDIGDLERVEVLRGPQGTLFGRNTLAGAVSFVTRKPSDKLRIEGEASYGNYNYMAFRGLVNVPITNNLFVKVAGMIQQRDGFTKLVPDPYGVAAAYGRGNGATGDLDDRDRYSIIAQVRWMPTDRLTIDYTYDRSQTHEHPFTSLYAIGTNPVYDDPALIASGQSIGNIFDPHSPNFSFPGVSLYVVPNDNRPKTTSNNLRSRDYSKVYGHALTVAYDLGPATLKSITAYRKVSIDQAPLGNDIDGTPLDLALGGFDNKYKQFSQELQLTGNLLDDRLSYVVGGYYYKDNAQGDDPQYYFLGASQLETQLGIRSKAWAAYGQADFKVTDKLTVTGGLRWTSERKQVNRLFQLLVADINGDGIPEVFNPPLTTINITKADNVHKTFSNVSPTGIIAYQFTPDLNVYAKYSVGFRSGNYNSDGGSDAVVRTPYKPEENRSFEVGVKSRFFDRRLTLNLAGFYNTEVNKQVASFLPSSGASTTINSNAGKARVKGIELEFDARPVEILHVYGSVGLLRTKFLKYMDTYISNLGADGKAGTADDTTATINVAKNRYFPKAPRTTLQGGVDLRVFSGDDKGNVTVSGDVQYMSKTFALPGQITYDPRFSNVATADTYRIPSVTTVNGRLRWDEIALGGSGLKGYAMLWVKNLTNERKVVNKISFGPTFGGLTDANYMDPRTYGVTFGFKY